MNFVMDDNIEIPEKKHSQFIYASNASFQFTVTFMSAAQTIFLFFYYEAVLGLSAWMVLLGLTIFAVYDGVNDPIIGFLVDRNFKWTRKWGRRFPWLVIGFVPWCLSLYLIFSAPNIDARVNPWPVFFWLLFSLIMFDTFGTLVNVNIAALRPDKFRTEDERRILSGYFGVIDMIAQALGMLLPPLFLGAGEGREAYALMGALVATIGIVSCILWLPGSREDKYIIDRYYSKKEEEEKSSFLKGLYEVVTTKSFMVFIITLIAFNAASNLMMGNVIYLTTFVLQADPDTVTLIFAVFLIGALVSIPFWMRLQKKMQNNKKVLTIGGIVFCIALIPMTFFYGLIDLLIIGFILGFAMGCMWIYFWTLILANVVDDFVVKTGKNQKGILIGAIALISRVGATIDELCIAAVHDITGFVPGYETYADMAAVVGDMQPIVWGIRFLAGVIPMLILLLGTLLFWFFYPLTQDKVLENKVKLKELGF